MRTERLGGGGGGRNTVCEPDWEIEEQYFLGLRLGYSEGKLSNEIKALHHVNYQILLHQALG